MEIPSELVCFPVLIPSCFPFCRAPGDFGDAGSEGLQHPEFICWLGFPVWLWDGVTRNTRSLCLGRAMPRAMGVFLAGQEWELLPLRMRTDAVPAHFRRNASAALLAAACVYPVSSYLSPPGAFPKSAGVHPTPFPTLLPALLILSSVFAVCLIPMKGVSWQQPSA